MKNYFVMIAAFALVMTACTSKKEAGGQSEAAKKNLEANRAIVAMFEKGDWSKVGDYIATDAIDHGAGPTGGDVVGLDSIKANFDAMGQMMGEMKNEVIKEMADDEYVMSWMKQSAVAKVDAPEWGMKKGVRNTYNSIEVSKYRDGKVVEHWSFMSMADMMKMMGGGSPMQDMPTDTTTPAKDTTSK